jgi:hypothetical protein
LTLECQLEDLSNLRDLVLGRVSSAARFPAAAPTLIFFTLWLFYLIYRLSEITFTLPIAWFILNRPRRAASSLS